MISGLPKGQIRAWSECHGCAARKPQMDHGAQDHAYCTKSYFFTPLLVNTPQRVLIQRKVQIHRQPSLEHINLTSVKKFSWSLRNIRDLFTEYRHDNENFVYEPRGVSHCLQVPGMWSFFHKCQMQWVWVWQTNIPFYVYILYYCWVDILK